VGRHRLLARRIALGAVAALAPAPVRAQTSAAPITAELTAAQRAYVESGKQLFVTVDVKGASWPRTIVYRLVAATPEEAAAVFTDYARHASYIPELKKSVVSRVVDAATAEVEYTLDVPIFPDEDYTVRDRLRRYAVGADTYAAAYRVDWTLVRASSTRSTVGNVRFEPYRHPRSGQPATLMAYDNFVVPGSSLAGVGIVRRQAMRQVQATAESIALEVERQRRTDPAALQRNVARLREALGK
jgi:hypothetical protein